MAQTFFFYDYETTGIDPKRDRVIQFAGVRTDEDFNIISDPIVEYCKLSRDIVPNLEAILVTGISYDTLDSQGLSEVDFYRLIYKEFSQANTCVLGYNSIRFDDEFTRYSFYRNFYDPYAREWQNNNSRWDLIDVVRMCAALRPDGINWPINSEGKISFKLEELTKANNLLHAKAHDALSDVYATIEIAKLIKKNQPRLFNYLLNCRKKDFIKKNIQVSTDLDVKSKLFVHSSRMISSEFYATSIFVPLMQDPLNQNGFICWDLRHDPKVLLELNNNIDRAKYLLYTSSEDMKPGENRLGLKTVFINKAPALAPVNTVDDACYSRLKLDKDVVLANAELLLRNQNNWFELIKSLYSEKMEFSSSDAEHMLYDKFIDYNNKQLCTRVHFADYYKLKDLQESFSDARLKVLLFRYRARNYPETLSDDEKLEWQNYCHDRLDNNNDLATVSRQEFIEKAHSYLNQNKSQEQGSLDKAHVVKSWLNYFETQNMTSEV